MFIFFRYLYLLAFCWPDTETNTDSKNVYGRIQIQIQIVKNFSSRIQIQIVKTATICPDNRYFDGYPCISRFQFMKNH